MDKKSPIYKLLIEEFGSLSHATRKMKFKSRQSMYDLIEAGKPSTRARNIIIAAGYDPVTFKPAVHVEKEK